MRSKHCIFISVDKNFIKHLKVCLWSIKKHYWNHPDIIICHTNLTQQDIDKLQKIVPIIPLHNTIKEEELWPIMSHLPSHINPRVFYARFLIRRHPLFQEYDNILHLDADTIIRKECDEIFTFTSFYIEKEAYRWENQIFFDINNTFLQQQLDKDCIKINNQAWNAWVFMSPKSYNNMTTYNELLYILTHYKEWIQWADQSVIAIWLSSHNIKPMQSHIYNLQHRDVERQELDSEFKNAKVIHFNGVHHSYRLLCMKLWIHLFWTVEWRKIYRLLYRIITIFYNW